MMLQSASRGSRVRFGLYVLLVSGAAASAVHAQPVRSGPVLSAVASAVASETHTSWAGSASFGYRFSPVVELQLEFTGTPEVAQRIDFPRIAAGRRAMSVPAALVPVRDEPGRALMFTTNARIHMPLTTTRLSPYFTAGGGVGHLQRKEVIEYGPLVFVDRPLSALGLSISPGLSRQTYTFSETRMMLTIGGGLSVRLTDRFSVDADLRYFRALGERDVNIGRFGGGVSYVF